MAATDILKIYLAFLKEMHSVGKRGANNPGHLFGQVCRRSPQFRGFQQQDAHELLRHLMDSLRTEEVKRQKTSILKQFGLSEKTDPKTVSAIIKKKLQVRLFNKRKLLPLCSPWQKSNITSSNVLIKQNHHL